MTLLERNLSKDRNLLWEVKRLHELGRGASEIGRIVQLSSAKVAYIIQTQLWHEDPDNPGVPDRCPDCGGRVTDNSRPCLMCSINKKKR